MKGRTRVDSRALRFGVRALLIVGVLSVIPAVLHHIAWGFLGVFCIMFALHANRRAETTLLEDQADALDEWSVGFSTEVSELISTMAYKIAVLEGERERPDDSEELH